jgi:hypothetical protein
VGRHVCSVAGEIDDVGQGISEDRELRMRIGQDGLLHSFVSYSS